MIRLIEYTKLLNEYDEFLICYSSKFDNQVLIGKWYIDSISHMHYIAISDSKEELQMWIDLRNITVKKVTKC